MQGEGKDVRNPDYCNLVLKNMAEGNYHKGSIEEHMNRIQHV